MPAKKTSKPSNETKADASANPSVESSLSFEEAMDDLESLIERIESGEIGLENSLKEYERGLHLFRHCRSILSQAEQRFEKLRIETEGEDEDEQP